MMLPGQQESQMNNQCEFGHQVCPLTLRGQPDKFFKVNSENGY